AVQLIFFKLGYPVALGQFTIEWGFLLMVGGVFTFFGAARERSAERLTQIADWPHNRLHSYANIDEQWLDASLDHIATVLQAPRVPVVWEIVQEPYCFSAMFAHGRCQHDRTMASGGLVSVELKNLTFATEAVESNECFTLTGARKVVGPIINKSIQKRFNLS